MLIRITSIVVASLAALGHCTLNAQEDVISPFPNHIFSGRQSELLSDFEKMETLYSLATQQLQGGELAETLFTSEQVVQIMTLREEISREFALQRITYPDKELDELYGNLNESASIAINDLKYNFKDGWSRIEALLNQRQVLGHLGDLLDIDEPDFSLIASNPLAWLSNAKLADAIGLTEAQKKKIKELLGEGREQALKLFEEKEDQITKKRTRKEAAIWKSLVPVQSGKLRQWRGESANVAAFMSLPGMDQEFDDSDQSSSDVIVTSSTVADREEQFNSEVVLDYSLYFVLRNNNSPKTLELTKSHQRQIDNIVDNKFVTIRLKNRNLRRLLDLLEDQWSLPDWLGQVLLPHQQKWLQELEFQLFTLAERDSFGLLNQNVARALELTPQQQSELKNIVEQFRQEQANLENEFKSELKDMYQRIFREIFGLLTTNQQKTMTTWFGRVQ